MSDTLGPKAAARQAARAPDTAPAITFWDVSETEQAHARAAARPEGEAFAEPHADFWGVGQSVPDAGTQLLIAEKTLFPEAFNRELARSARAVSDITANLREGLSPYAPRAHPEDAAAPAAIDLSIQSEGAREAILRSASEARAQDAEATLLRDLTRATERFLTATGSALTSDPTQEFQAIQTLPALAQFLIQEFIREVKMAPTAPHPDATMAIENTADAFESAQGAAQGAQNSNGEEQAIPQMTREELAQAFQERLRARKAPATADTTPAATPASPRSGF